MKSAPHLLHDLDGSNTEIATQYAALCLRVRKKKLQVLMITSRRNRRWVLPKGWPMDGKSGAETAAQEAWEEAGVRGKCSNDSIGMYTYIKEAEKKEEVDQPCAVMVYPLKVKSLAGKHPEKGQRVRKWMSCKKAARKVWEPELAELLRGLKQDVLKL
ncbi:NUDIX hydrolase [Mesobacterium sp. TK19101]|uniref:NUDIX hydrolase n=1 Tax=Mesobacterium hydrothermale TaxID=3111907 RepID=A0ABU6HJJ2_9RHOB|nr:NUDIX hydrolase [Mesobacterium sp. TK19101]MEC3862044.1 NUDIX hydrolase [Mesobacterium sp. TK19101]